MLRSTVSLLVALLAAPASAADGACETGVRLFPTPGATVPTNVQLVLEGLAGDASRVAGLVGTGELALFGGGDAVPVTVETAWVSAMSRAAVRLRPTRPLSPNTQYSLGLGRALERVRLLNDTYGDNTPRWRTGLAADTAPPTFSARPAVSEGLYQRTANGLTRTLKLRTQVVDVGATYLVVTMSRTRGPAMKQQYVVPVVGQMATLGHDPCSGSFGFEDGRSYALKVELVDAAGNHARASV
ncbi:MAG: hypothetical protein INH37_13905, partial [Myxococcaceae bacterium]|nr:hypothetical protein [Myxococcaceae bacterium]